jgi:hypothetical protein
LEIQSSDTGCDLLEASGIFSGKGMENGSTGDFSLLDVAVGDGVASAPEATSGTVGVCADESVPESD